MRALRGGDKSTEASESAKPFIPQPLPDPSN